MLRLVSSFEDVADGASHKKYLLPAVEIKDYHVMIDGINFLDQRVKNDI